MATMSAITAISIIEEEVEATEEQIAEAFQYLIDTGIIWSLQGSYQRAAAALVEAGKCTVPD